MTPAKNSLTLAEQFSSPRKKQQASEMSPFLAMVYLMKQKIVAPSPHHNATSIFSTSRSLLDQAFCDKTLSTHRTKSLITRNTGILTGICFHITRSATG